MLVNSDVILMNRLNILRSRLDRKFYSDGYQKDCYLIIQGTDSSNNNNVHVYCIFVKYVSMQSIYQISLKYRNGQLVARW